MFIFQKRVERMLKQLEEKNEEIKRAESDDDRGPKLEKNDRLAIVLAGLLVFVPVILIICTVMFGLIWLFAGRFA